MTPLHGEYRVTAHPDDPERILVRWRPSDQTPVWIHLPEAYEDYHAASLAMEAFTGHGCVS